MIRQSLRVLVGEERRRFLFLLIQIMFQILFDLFSLVSVLPLLLLFFDPEIIIDSPYASYFGDLFNKPLKEVRITLTIGIFVFFCLKASFSYVVLKRKALFMTRIVERITRDMFDVNLRNVRGNDHRTDSGDLLQRIVNLPEKYVFKSLRALFEIFSNLIMASIILSALMLFKSDVFFLMVLVLTPTTIFYLNLLRKKTKGAKSDIKENTPLLIQNGLEAINGQVEIMISGKQQYFKDRFSAINHKLYVNIGKLLTLTNTSHKIMELIAIVGISSMFLYLTFTDTAPEKAITLLTVFTISTFRLIPSINALITAMTELRVHQYTAEVLLDRSGQTFDQNTDNDLPLNITFDKAIKFDKISFEYEKSDFKLSNLSFEVKKQESLAIVGKSGAGKSTVIKILLRLVKEKRGSVSVDGVALSEYPLNAWWQSIAYVPQAAFLFKGTLMENICMGISQSAQEKLLLETLLIDLELSDLIDALPDGLNMLIDENGSNISTGQRQRIGIARAIWQDRPIMIFDEVTSNLDEVSRKKVIKTISKVLEKGKTAIFVTHDAELMEHCDQVVNLDTLED